MNATTVTGFIRFVGSILIRDIEGRQKALDLEDKYIGTYRYLVENYKSVLVFY